MDVTDIDLGKLCMKVHGQELTVYYKENTEQTKGQKCHICTNPVANGFTSLFEVHSVINEAMMDVAKGSPLFNEAQAELRKKLYHGLTVCERASCEQTDVAQRISAS
jgi:hypothetical protein